MYSLPFPDGRAPSFVEAAERPPPLGVGLLGLGRQQAHQNIGSAETSFGAGPVLGPAVLVPRSVDIHGLAWAAEVTDGYSWIVIHG